MASVGIIIPTWNNFPMLVRCLESIRDYTEGVDWRLIVVDNASTDDTPRYLQGLINQGVPLTTIRNDSNLGFIKATNQGLKTLEPHEHAVLANDDIIITDSLWLKKYIKDLEDPQVGEVVCVSNYVMGLQGIMASYQIPKHKHTSHLGIYICGLIRNEALQKVGLLDERFGIGGNDDLDYSIRMYDAGYKILVDRDVFVFHVGSRTLSRTEGDMEGVGKLDTEKRKILVEKWGQERVNWIFELPDDLKAEEAPKEKYGPEYYARFGHGGYKRNEFWLGEWGRIASKIITTLRPRTVFDAGCALGMLVEALTDQGRGGIRAWGMDISDYAISQARDDIKDFLRVGSLANPVTLDNMDLVTCIEVLEHIPEKDVERSISNLCSITKTILFSSCPTDRTEPTHVNVQPRHYWVNLFGKFGFAPDESYDASWLTPWAMLLRRTY